MENEGEAMNIGPYKVSNTNASGKYPNRVRVSLNGTIIAEVVSPHNNPYKHLCKWGHSVERKALTEALKAAGVSDVDVAC